MRFKSSSLLIGVAFASCAFLAAQDLGIEPHREAGQSVTGVYEGWFQNPDGTYSLLAGYYNRNLVQALDIPVGPNNKIEPGNPDRGQPTYFLPGRQWGLFVITVPKDFGTQKLTWTIVANGKSTVIPLSLAADWEIKPFVDATDNTPPFLSFKSFDDGAAMLQGPIPLRTSLNAKVGVLLSLTVWAADDNKTPPGRREPKYPVTVMWSKFRGPGQVSFSNSKPIVEKTGDKLPGNATFAGKATTTATFSQPGDYTLYVVLNDVSGIGGGGFQCCWTNGMVDVTVEGSPSNIVTGE